MAVRLVQCVASRSGLFRNKTIGFSDKVTVIYGPNDSGKSFLSNILADLAVTSFLGDSSVPIDWANTHIDLTLEHDGSELVISRTSGENFSVREKCGSAESPLVSGIPGRFGADESSRMSSSALERYLRMIHRLGSAGFRETAFVESPLDGGKSVNYALIRKLFLEDESNFHELRSLMKRTFSENRISGVPGILEQIEEHEKELKLLEKQIQLSNIQDERRQKMREELEQTAAEIESLSAETEKLEATLSDAKAIFTLREEICADDEEIAAIEQDRTLEQEKIRSVALVRDTLAKIFPKFTDFSQMHRENLSKIQSAYRTIRSSNERVRSIAEKKETLRRRFRQRACAILILTAAAASAVLFVPQLHAYAGIVPYAAGAAAGAGTLILLTVFLVFRSSIRRLPEEAALASKKENELSLKAVLRENGLTVDGLGPDEIYELLLQYFEEYGLFTEQESDIQDMESTLRTGEFFDEADQRLRELRLSRKEKEEDIRAITARLSKDHAHVEVDDLFVTSLENRIARLDAELDNAKELHSRLTEELAIGPDDTGRETGLNEQISFHRGKLVTLSRRNRLAHYITTLMDEAVAKREDILSRRLASQTAAIFHRITSNQYITSINEPAILSFMKGENTSFNPQIAHMISLSLKLALSDRLAEEHISIPLFIDEPVVYMDATRIKNFIEIVRECSKQRQIIILSHDKALCDSAETVIELQPG